MILNKKFYDKFPKDTNLFVDFCYDISQEQIDKARKASKDNWYINDNTAKGILLLLFCWNSAARKTKQLTTEDILGILKRQAHNLKSLEGFSVMDNWEGNRDNIGEIYKEFKKTLDQTGASKALSLLNPKLFVMWDTRIRKFLGTGKIDEPRRISRKIDEELRIKGISNGEEPENYLTFLGGIKNIIKLLDLDKKIDNPDKIAKKIDEYHFVKIVMGRH